MIPPLLISLAPFHGFKDYDEIEYLLRRPPFFIVLRLRFFLAAHIVPKASPVLPFRKHTGRDGRFQRIGAAAARMSLRVLIGRRRIKPDTVLPVRKKNRRAAPLVCVIHLFVFPFQIGRPIFISIKKDVA
jgi:hypothetical protein